VAGPPAGKGPGPAARADLRAPPGRRPGDQRRPPAVVVAGRPAYATRSGRHVDPPHRIRPGLTAASPGPGGPAADHRVCALLVWSRRFADLTDPRPPSSRRAATRPAPAYGAPKLLWASSGLRPPKGTKGQAGLVPRPGPARRRPSYGAPQDPNPDTVESCREAFRCVADRPWRWCPFFTSAPGGRKATGRRGRARSVGTITFSPSAFGLPRRRPLGASRRPRSTAGGLFNTRGRERIMGPGVVRRFGLLRGRCNPATGTASGNSAPARWTTGSRRRSRDRPRRRAGLPSPWPGAGTFTTRPPCAAPFQIPAHEGRLRDRAGDQSDVFLAQVTAGPAPHRPF